MVLTAIGLPHTEDEIRKLCRQTVIGLRLAEVPMRLSDLPIVANLHKNWGLDDLRDEIRNANYPIVGVDLRPIDGRFAYHAVVVAMIESDKVIVHDPEPNRGIRDLKLTTFLAAWKGAGQQVLMILPKNQT